MEEYYLIFNDGEEEILKLHVYHEEHYAKEEIYTIVKKISKKCFEKYGENVEEWLYKNYIQYALTHDYDFTYNQPVNIFKYEMTDKYLDSLN
ncbi:hypothetical protein AF332_11575 [Sporosarcina globispora]|uniref:Uncharacterized protein n=1 Tax=Sporosarcina globispora TaxID=1459 RepID=A0A0M0GCZ0_SPOGL|nr:hypothetical protein [Sporosarcina globispora]KON87402.1 hypothetical protein AF332_11575 [Sporosarcina globispora]